MSSIAGTLTWNGKDRPPELTGMPPGQYAIEATDSVEPIGLSVEQVEGLRAGSRSLDEGHGAPWAMVEARFLDKLTWRVTRATLRK